MTTTLPFVKVELWRCRGHQPRDKEQAPAVQRQPLAMMRVTLVGCKTHEPNWELTRREEKTFRRTNTRSLLPLGVTAQQGKQYVTPGYSAILGYPVPPGNCQRSVLHSI
jgi:hypothetical protein